MPEKGLKQVVDVHRNALVHPYFTRQPNEVSKMVCGCVVLQQTVVQNSNEYQNSVKDVLN